MKQFIVKSIAVAKDNNPTFKGGEMRIHYIGKGWVYDSPDVAKLNSWKRRWAAEKFINDMNEWNAKNARFWEHEYEVIEVA